jgi:hypothetical protein
MYYVYMLFLTVHGAAMDVLIGDSNIVREFPHLSTSFDLLFQYTQKINNTRLMK